MIQSLRVSIGALVFGSTTDSSFNGVCILILCETLRIPDPSAPTTRTFAISEEMLESVDLQSDWAEVFEFAGDFQELMDRDFYLRDVGNTVEFHVVEEDGSIVSSLPEFYRHIFLI